MTKIEGQNKHIGQIRLKRKKYDKSKLYNIRLVQSTAKVKRQL